MSQITQLIQQKRSASSNKLHLIHESNDTRSELFHQKWENYCNALPPHICITLDSAITGQCKRSYKAFECRFIIDGFQDQVAKTHQNHRHFYHLYYLSMLEMNFYIVEKQIDPSIYCFTSQRALKNKNGKFELLKVITQPYSFSKDGRVLDYVSWYIPLKEYQGEPFTTEIISLKSSNDKLISQIKSILKDQKRELIHYLNFTERQKEVIVLLSKSQAKLDIAKSMHVSIRTVEKYNQQILSRGQDIFPLNTFRTAVDVVEYLRQMEIL